MVQLFGGISFIALQSLQALIFQLTAFLARVVTFGLLAIGFYLATFSGLIARTGFTEPELTSALLIAAVVGFTAVLFFQWIFPLWGVWAAIRILCGRNFRYPILNNIAIKWYARHPINFEGISTGHKTFDGEAILAGITHLSILGGLAPILAPILWATAKRRSRFLTHNLLQAAIFQLFIMGASSIWFLSSWLFTFLFAWLGELSPMDVLIPVRGITDSPLIFFGGFGVMAILVLITGLSALIGAIRTFKGKKFNYPIVGKWLVRYLG